LVLIKFIIIINFSDECLESNKLSLKATIYPNNEII